MKFNTIFIAFISIAVAQSMSISSAHAQVLQNMNPFRNKEQKYKSAFTDEEITKVRQDINNLAGVKMKGRIVGTEGEKVAADYIASRMKQIGLQEVDKNFQRKFSFTDGQVVSGESVLHIGKEILKVPFNGYPISFSGLQAESNFIIDGVNESNNIWVISAFKNAMEAKLPVHDREKLLYEKAQNAIDRGAIGIIFYNNLGKDAIIPFQHKSSLEPLSVPIYEITNATYEQYIKHTKKLTQVKLEPVIKPTIKEGMNVYGVINNYAKKTVIISANYDGFVNDSGDPYQANAWPCANDNASGVAAVLALAQKLRTARLNYNYIIIAYSGRNKNLIGSEKFLNDKNVAKNQIAYAIHFDKIGKLNANTDLFISGVATTTAFKQLFQDKNPSLKYVLANRGMDKSDYQNYHEARIPYLNFSTGDDPDAGSVADQANKIRMNGMITVLDKAYETIMFLDQQVADYNFVPAIDFVENVTPSQDPATIVSLGVTPDLNHKEDGMRITQVAKGKPAAIGGLQAGDIIVQIRNFPVQNYDQYIEVMKKFKKGDKVYIKFKRNGMFLQKVVEFD